MPNLTPAAAGERPCPMARTFAEKHGPNCEAGSCILWRWTPLPADAIKPAVHAEAKRLASESGKTATMHHKEAVANVMADPDAHGVNLNPTHGYCGLGGKPEV